MLISLLEAAPNTYNPSRYAALARKQYSIQLRGFNPEYLGRLGDTISKYTGKTPLLFLIFELTPQLYIVNKYLMNADKKLYAEFDERTAELILLYFVPTFAGLGALTYFMRSKKKPSKKEPGLAKL